MMDLLVDTHFLLWAEYSPAKLSPGARLALEDLDNTLYFSVVSLWEIAVKRKLHRTDFGYDPAVLRTSLLASGYYELEVAAPDVLTLEQLPSLHRDPFDRLLLCQTIARNLTLLTKDKLLTEYPVSVRRV